MRTIQKIDEEIQELEKKKKELLREKEEFLNLTPAQQLAEILHDKQCHWNHTDGCGWFYESWSNPGYSRTEYLKKAENMLKEVNLDTAIKVLNLS